MPQPRTILASISTSAFHSFMGGNPEGLEDQLPHPQVIRSRIGYPLFLRTDYLSDKHSYEHSCYLEDEEDLLPHIWALASKNFAILGPDPSALAFRAYIPLASQFTAFMGNLPIAPERRYFVRDGAVQCRHSYWPSDSIEPASPSHADWRELLAEMNRETDEEIALLSHYAEQVGEVLEGYWSVDFALSADGRWLLIDCAEGERSYHWKGCGYAG